MAHFTEHGIRLSSMCPTFLNSNSTSHTWPFSAIAELIDNAADPGVFAKQIWINTHEEAGQLCMTFTDNGSGMTPNKLHKMLSFGFTEKGIRRSGVQAIGVYGNGFKSGSMRLGRDALIFTKNGGCQSVGMLSQTYLENIKAQSVIVPIVPFNQQTNSLVVTEDSEASLAAILQHSIITSQEQIQAHFDSISSKKGTKILIWNLRRAKDGNTEIDFETDPSDFRLPEIQIEELKKNLKNSGLQRGEQIIPEMHYSLKAYLSILYLMPRIQIILRGKKIPTKLVSQQLTHVEYDVYKPHFSKDKVKVTFGINAKNKDCYGIMMYHKNRLIKAYEKVGCQLKSSGPRAGVGIIGVIECDFLKPAHNKQDFEYTKEYRLTLGALGMKLNEYWREVMERKARLREFEAVTKEQNCIQHEVISDKGPLWLQCEECLKWRSVPNGHYKVIPENWSCSQNPNPRYRSCSSPEETDASEDLQTPSYHKPQHKRDYSRTKQTERSSKLEESVSQKDSPQHSFSETVSSSAEETQPAELLSTEPVPSEDLANEPEETEVNSGLGTTCTKDRDSVIKDAVVIHKPKAPEPSLQQDEEAKETPVEQEETAQEQHETPAPLSLKRKLKDLMESAEKRRCLMDEQVSSSEKENNPILPERISDTCESAVQNHYVQPPIETPEDSREARVKKLAELERESLKLRQLLGLETTTKSQLTTTTAATNTESADDETRTVPTRDAGSQTEMTEKSVSSGSKSPLSKHHEALIQGSRALCGFKEPEQSKARKEKNEGSRSSASEDHGVRLVQDKLCGIRNNVVVLLTALLPQLDLSGISLETTDVDSILQQIIEVNALKL